MTPLLDVPHKRATLIAIAMMVLVSIAVAIMTNTPKPAYQEGANPMTVITIRAVIATLILSLSIAVTHGQFRLSLALIRLAWCTSSISVAMLFSFYTAIQYTGVSLTILILFVNRFLISIFNHVTGISRLTLIAVFSGVVGLGFALAVNFIALDPVRLVLAALPAIFAAHSHGHRHHAPQPRRRCRQCQFSQRPVITCHHWRSLIDHR
jgi:drug/metabolite transporter (DMT)-like permease